MRYPQVRDMVDPISLAVPEAWLRSPERAALVDRTNPLYVAIERKLTMRRFQRLWDRIVDACWRYGRLLQRLHVDHDTLRWIADEVRDELVRLGAALYADRQVHDRAGSVDDVHRVLVGLLSASVTRGRMVVTFTELRARAPKGPQLGGERGWARTWPDKDLEEAVPALIDQLSRRYQRERQKRPRWFEDLAKLMGNVQPLTVKTYIKKSPRLGQYLAEARRKNKAIREMAPRRA